MVNTRAVGGHFDAQLARGSRGHRTDGDRLHAFERRRARGLHEVLHGGGTGEGDQIGLARAAEDFAGVAARRLPGPPCDRLPPRPRARRAAPVPAGPDREPRPRAAAGCACPARSCAAKASSRPSATYSLPIRSTFRCSASTAARVAGPMAQILARSARRSAAERVQTLQEEAHAVGAGEDQPIVGGELARWRGRAARNRRRAGSRWWAARSRPRPAPAGARRARRPAPWRASPRCACRRAAAARTNRAFRAAAPLRPR